MAKVMAMQGKRTAVTDLCTFGLAACDERGDHQCETSWGAVAEQMPEACIDTLRSTRTTQSRRGEQTGSWVRHVARAMEEQLNEEETCEHQRKVEDAKRIRRIAHENDKNKGSSHEQNEMGRLNIMMSRSCSVCGKDGTGLTTKAGGLIRTCAPRQDVKKWSAFVATGCTRGSRNLLS